MREILELTWYATGSTSQLRIWTTPYSSQGRADSTDSMTLLQKRKPRPKS